MSNRNEVIELLAMEYDQQKITTVVDKMIELEGLDPSDLPENFDAKVIDSFSIVEEQRQALPSADSSGITLSRPSAASIQKAESLGISQEMLNLTACIVLENSTEEIDKILDARDQVVQRQIASRNLELVKQISFGTSTKDPDHYKKLAIEYGIIKDPENQQKEQNNFLQKLVEDRELKKKKQQEESEAKKQKELENQQQHKDKESELLARFYQSLRNTPID